MVPLAPERILKLVRRHLPNAEAITAVFEDGWHHVGYEIDGDSVLKITRRSVPTGDLAREAAVLKTLIEIPGLPLPRLITSGYDAVLGEYSLTPRIPGRQLGSVAAWPQGAVREAAQFAANLHSQAVGTLSNEGVPALDIQAFWSRGMSWLQRRGHVTPAKAPALDAVFQRSLEHYPVARRVLLHGDLWPSNILVDDAGNLTGVIDFGDGAIGPPAWDLALPGGKDDLWSDALTAEYARLTKAAPEFEEEVRFFRWVRCVGLGGFTEGWAKEEYRDDVERTAIDAARNAGPPRTRG